MSGAEVEGQSPLREETHATDELRVGDRPGRLPSEQTAHADDERLRCHRREVSLDPAAMVDGCVGDDAAHGRVMTGKLTHPANLIQRLLLAAVSLHEYGAEELVVAGVEILRAEPPPERCVGGEPGVIARPRIPEVHVSVDDHVAVRVSELVDRRRLRRHIDVMCSRMACAAPSGSPAVTRARISSCPR